MNEKHINEFIDKAIQKTKNAELHWQAIPNDFIINPLPDDDSGSTSIVINAKELYANYSYIASYKTGYLLLLVYSNSMGMFFSAPPNGCFLSLRMQDNVSKYASEITNSNQSLSDATALIRLYNLIDKSTSSVSSLIQDFLNS